MSRTTFKKDSSDEIVIKGEGFTVSGGGGGESYPKVFADNLRSNDYMEVILGIGEGPIYGLEEGAKSLYLDSTPLVSQSGAINYPDYELNVFNGDSTQEEVIKPILGGLTAGAVSVGSPLIGYTSSDPYDSPDYNNDNLSRVIIVETNRHDFDFIDLKIAVNSLYFNWTGGDVYAGDVILDVKWQEVGSTFWEQIPHERTTIKGKTTSTYMVEWRLWMPVWGLRNNVRIRVAVVGVGSSTESVGTVYSLTWTAYELGFCKELHLDDTAAIQLALRSTNRLSSQPSVSGIYKLLKVKIPSNYDPETKTYDGDWDGTFNFAWTDNPAWCLYDYLTNSRYGLNSFYPFEVDKWDFYEAGKFCDELVSDGKGGKEARYTFNAIYDSVTTGREIAQEIASSFNAVLYSNSFNIVRLKVLRDDSPAVHLFSPENILEGTFNYTFNDPSECYNTIECQFVNSEENWIDDSREIVDESNVASYGTVSTTMKLKGCIKESEALRRAWYALLTYTTESMGVTFKTNRAGQNVSVGDVILISDPLMGYSQSGRLVSVNDDKKSVKLREPVFIESTGLTGDVVYFVDFQIGAEILSYELNVTEIGEVSTLQFKDILDERIGRQTLFTFRTSEITSKGNPKPFRIVSIKEDEYGETVEITAFEINRQKQYAADNKVLVGQGEYSELPPSNAIPHILNLKFTESFSKTKKIPYLYLYPELDSNYPYYKPNAFEVYFRFLGESAWNQISYSEAITIQDPPIGKIEWAVLPVNRLGQTPDLDSATPYRFDTYDINEPPDNVIGVEVENGLVSSRISWIPVEDPDIICYEIREVPEGMTWDEGKVLTYATVNTEYTYVFKEDSTHRIMIRAKDVLGTYSQYPAVVYVSPKFPENIKEFYATPNNDNIRFDWVADIDVNVEYEVRTGATDWSSGITLFKTKSLNQTILNPCYGYKGFFIKAVSPLGKYSEKAAYTELSVELKQDRNVIYTWDAPEHHWEGVLNGFVKSDNEQVLLMDDLPYGGYYADYYFPVHFERIVRARNWVEATAFKYNNRLTFADLEFPWNSEEAKATSWLNSSGLSVSEGQCFPVITWSEPDKFFHDLGFSLASTLTDVSFKYEPYISESVSYGNDRMMKTLILNRKVDVKYKTLPLEERFTLRFTVKLTFESIDYYKIMRLTTEDESAWVDFAIEENHLKVKWSDGKIQSIKFNRFRSYDFIFVSVSQSEAMEEGGIRILRCAVEKTGEEYYSETVGNPLGKFTKMFIGSRYD